MSAAASRVLVLGAGGHAKVVVATLQAAGAEVAAVLDDAPGRQGASLGGVPVGGPVAAVIGGAAICAIGDNRARQGVVAGLATAWATAVHPSAVVHESVLLGPGTVVFAGAVVQPDAVLGAHVIVNTGATVDHDCRLGDFVHVAPGAHLCGGVTVDEGALLGVGCAVAPGVRIGAWATVGAAAAVVADVPAGATVIGVPAQARPPR
ncbi:MAG TPA: NeuD/PglB/VioB family sugar acetyltransferase [Thermoanaerobaculia bacterium]|nr:NeuD/PglB/VioB family sugar acetyltransferase [Thermoanaerobaculia bacterium]